MAFDRNDPAQVLALFNEWNLDPASVGYATSNNTVQLLNLTNEPENNPGGETLATPFSPQSLMDALDPTEYESPQTVAGAPNYVHTLIELGAFNSIEPYKAKFRSMFAANSATVTTLDAQTVPLSRADVLWGYETNITRDDYAAVIAAHGVPF